MAIDRDQLLLEMHGDLRELRAEMRAHIAQQNSLVTKVAAVEKKVTWVSGVAAAVAAMITFGLSFARAYFSAKPE